jgi:glycosyltransferase involved in cell wall biosynthesis
MVKKFGIYLQNSIHESINEKGISRVTEFLIKGLLRDENSKVTIAIPSWLTRDTIKLLDDIEIDKSRVDILSPGKSNFVRIFTSAQKIQIKTSRFFKRNKLVENIIFLFARKFISRLVNANSINDFLILCLLLIFFSFNFIFLFFIKMFFRLTKNSNSKFISKLNLTLRSYFNGVMNLCRKLFRSVSEKSNKNKAPAKTVSTWNLNNLKNTKSRFLNYLLSAFKKIINLFLTREKQKIIKLVNSSEIRAWYIPTITWTEAMDIQSRKIFAVPDFIFWHVPLCYSELQFHQFEKNLTQLHATDYHIICYSDYVKNHHILNRLLVPESNVSVIKHGSMNQRSYLEIDNYFPESEYKHNALRILAKYQKAHIEWPYLRHFDFASVPFIFYSSQVRYHKNYFNLIKAFEVLLRERFNNIKLIVTGNIYQDQAALDIKKYIDDKKLKYDIISLPKIPSQVLAALGSLATLAVNPTLFEGGFPFTFTEAYSVGTPSVMSAIPVVVDEIEDEALKEIMLFDPYDLEDMINKIEWGINHSQELYRLQQPLYDRFAKRTWEEAANDYRNVFKGTLDDLT